MKRMRMLGLCLVAVFAIAAIGASAASAKSVLSLSTAAGELAAGDSITAFSSNLSFETVAGNLECEENELIGTISGNNEGKIHGSITEEISKGNFDEVPGACKTSATGPAFISSGGFPWPLELSDKGLGKLKGSHKIAFTSTFLAIPGPDNKCTFEASTVKDSFNASATKEPITIAAVKQKFKHNKKAPEQSSLCPSEGLLSGTFSVLHNGETVEGYVKTV